MEERSRSVNGAPSGERPAGARIKASPLSRRLARERGVDLAQVRGTGPDGRIVAEDIGRVETPAVPAAAAPAGEIESRPLSNVRRTIGRRLTQAWTVPACQLTVSDPPAATVVVDGVSVGLEGGTGAVVVNVLSAEVARLPAASLLLTR